MPNALYFEDLTPGDKQQFGAYQVTEQEIIEFAQRYDPQYFHLDAKAASDSLFGGLCASGWHTTAMFMRMLVDAMPEDNGSLGSPGIEQLRWLKPVYPDDILHVEGEVLTTRLLETKPGVGMVSMAYQVKNQQQQTVMTLNSNAFFRCRESK